LAVKFSTLSSFSFQALKANKMRSFLTILGVIIGVAAVILMMALGQGTQNQILGQINSMGTNLLTVQPGSSGQFVRSGTGTSTTLTLKDAQAVAQLPTVGAVAPTVRGSILATLGNQTWTTSMTGTTPDALQISSLQMASGRFISDSDVNNMTMVAVIGQTVYQNLFPAGADPIGAQIHLRGMSYKVVGLLGTMGATMAGDLDDSIYIPVTTAEVRVLGLSNQTINTMQVYVQDKNQMTSTQNTIESLLRQRHHLTRTQSDDFSIRNMAQLLAQAQNITNLLTIFLAGVAAISLLVGGIGVMNIMLVSVTERTREIGIRMAIGATRRAILSQFLLEAVLLSLTGSFLGIVLGFAGAKIFSLIAQWAAPVSLLSIALAVGFSIFIGVFFGFYPARRAAGLKPAEALNYE
jgi:putative ABC transport system permease protein